MVLKTSVFVVGETVLSVQALFQAGNSKFHSTVEKCEFYSLEKLAFTACQSNFFIFVTWRLHKLGLKNPPFYKKNTNSIFKVYFFYLETLS